jgi:hypothetical protein
VALITGEPEEPAMPAVPPPSRLRRLLNYLLPVLFVAGFIFDYTQQDPTFDQWLLPLAALYGLQLFGQLVSENWPPGWTVTLGFLFTLGKNGNGIRVIKSRQ